MFDNLKNLNIETCSDIELKAWVRQVVPIVAAFLQASQRLFAEEGTQDQSPCDNCDKRASCETLCERVESMLPGALSGSYVLNNTYGDLIDKMSEGDDSDEDGMSHNTNLKTVKVPMPEAIFKLYEGCQNIFTPKQWRVVYLRFKEGMQNVEITKELGMTQSSVSDMLKRARQKMEQHYRAEEKRTRSFT
ncbi:MAG: sigma-70 family RNA polymerase sigma factor [Candidatus Babeliaceae bacterium]|nr:sigma-70 family RNA polymerase sigma factor [Candidatus Babeliaceae bacterium]